MDSIFDDTIDATATATINESLNNTLHKTNLIDYYTMGHCCDCSTRAGALSLVAVSVEKLVSVALFYRVSNFSCIAFRYN